MSSVNNNLYEFGDFSLDAQGRTLRRGAATVPLTPKAFDVLCLLVQNAGTIVTKDELMKAVWPDSFVEESNLTQTVFMVRKALDETRRSTLHPDRARSGLPICCSGSSKRRVTVKKSRRPPFNHEAYRRNSMAARTKETRWPEMGCHRTSRSGASPDCGIGHLVLAFAGQPC